MCTQAIIHDAPLGPACNTYIRLDNFDYDILLKDEFFFIASSRPMNYSRTCDSLVKNYSIPIGLQTFHLERQCTYTIRGMDYSLHKSAVRNNLIKTDSWSHANLLIKTSIPKENTKWLNPMTIPPLRT